MSPRATRWTLFLAIACLAPAPMLVAFPALIPPARFLLLGVVTACVALQEGADGPVPGILALFLGHAFLYLLLAWLAAWAVTRLLSPFSDRSRAAVVLGAVLVMLTVAVVRPIYHTPFGRAAWSNLVGALS